jgi:vacuolar-type H+-ATPase subunit F/Vma7
MALVHYIGDEIGAAGWRLAGALVHVPAAGTEAAALAQARAQGELVLLSAAVAAQIDAATLQQAGAAWRPLLLVVPDTQGQVALPDFAARLRLQLGMEP